MSTDEDDIKGDMGKTYCLNEDYSREIEHKGDGRPDCEHCHGRGVTPADPEEESLTPIVRRCTCVLARDVLQNVERGWKGLTRAAKIKSSPLFEHLNQNLWITCPTKRFKSYLRHVAIRQGPDWDFKVISDIDLVSSWLGTAITRGMEIYDADVASRSKSTLAAITLQDLVEPPKLTIIRLGVKSTPNKAAPEVLMEALAHRYHKDKITWVFDQPHCRLQEGHICYSPQLFEFLNEDWPHERLELTAKATTGAKKRRPRKSSNPMLPQTFSGNFDQYSTRRVNVSVTDDDKKKKGKGRTPK